MTPEQFENHSMRCGRVISNTGEVITIACLHRRVCLCMCGRGLCVCVCGVIVLFVCMCVRGDRFVCVYVWAG